MNRSTEGAVRAPTLPVQTSGDPPVENRSDIAFWQAATNTDATLASGRLGMRDAVRWRAIPSSVLSLNPPMTTRPPAAHHLKHTHRSAAATTTDGLKSTPSFTRPRVTAPLTVRVASDT